MPYTPDKPPLPEPVESLRARIPGWGADLDPQERPAVPRELPVHVVAPWVLDDPPQADGWRERSVEHGKLPPVWGTSAPLRGVSGRIRRRAYDSYSEARAAHWLLLLIGDRVDAWTSHLSSWRTARPDQPLTETGVVAEIGAKPLRSRFGVRRADAGHHLLDPVIVAGPWVAAAGTAAIGAVALRRALHRRS